MKTQLAPGATWVQTQEKVESPLDALLQRPVAPPPQYAPLGFTTGTITGDLKYKSENPEFFADRQPAEYRGYDTLYVAATDVKMPEPSRRYLCWCGDPKCLGVGALT